MRFGCSDRALWLLCESACKGVEASPVSSLLGRVCSGSCQPHCPSLPPCTLVVLPCGPPSAPQQPRGTCQLGGSAGGRPPGRQEQREQPGGSQDLSGWGRTVPRGQAGATWLGLPGWRNQFICSQVLASAVRGGASKLKCIKPSDLSQSNTNPAVAGLEDTSRSSWSKPSSAKGH